MRTPPAKATSADDEDSGNQLAPSFPWFSAVRTSLPLHHLVISRGPVSAGARSPAATPHHPRPPLNDAWYPIAAAALNAARSVAVLGRCSLSVRCRYPELGSPRTTDRWPVSQHVSAAVAPAPQIKRTNCPILSSQRVRRYASESKSSSSSSRRGSASASSSLVWRARVRSATALLRIRL